MSDRIAFDADQLIGHHELEMIAPRLQLLQLLRVMSLHTFELILPVTPTQFGDPALGRPRRKGKLTERAPRWVSPPCKKAVTSGDDDGERAALRRSIFSSFARHRRR